MRRLIARSVYILPPTKLWIISLKINYQLIVGGLRQSKVQKCSCRDEDFMATWTELSQKLRKKKLEGMAFIFRKLWQRRNRWVFENSFQSPSEVITAAITDREEYNLARSIARKVFLGPTPVNRNVK